MNLKWRLLPDVEALGRPLFAGKAGMVFVISSEGQSVPSSSYSSSSPFNPFYFFDRGLIGDACSALPLQPDMQELSLEAQERKLEREENKNRSYSNCFNL